MTTQQSALPPVISEWDREPLQPIAPAERVETLDILRGFALLGILLVNMGMFSWPLLYDMVSPHGWDKPRDRLAEWLVSFLAEGKFYPLFSFLFGVGFAIQMERAQSLQASFARLFSRRLLVLLAIGLMHAFLLWEGDILVSYAVCGFLLLAFQRRKPKTLLIWAAIFLLLPVTLYALIWAGVALASLVPEAAKAIEQGFASERSNYRQYITENLRVFSGGTVSEIFAQRAKNVVHMWQYTLFFAPTFFAMFLLGLYAAQRRLVQNLETHLTFIRRALIWALALGVPLNLLYVIGASKADPLGVNFASVLAMAGSGIGGPALALAYGAALALLFRHQGWRIRLRPIAAAGRMALSNYLLQSLVCTTIFYSYGLGWYGAVGKAAGVGLAVVIYFVQVLLSLWWLGKFRFGPAEWLWRTLTYGKLQPMLLKE